MVSRFGADGLREGYVDIDIGDAVLQLAGAEIFIPVLRAFHAVKQNRAVVRQHRNSRLGAARRNGKVTVGEYAPSDAVTEQVDAGVAKPFHAGPNAVVPTHASGIDGATVPVHAVAAAAVAVHAHTCAGGPFHAGANAVVSAHASGIDGTAVPVHGITGVTGPVHTRRVATSTRAQLAVAAIGGIGPRYHRTIAA